MDLCDQIYDSLQACHDLGLRNQMERSSVSIPSNISEGFELNTNRAFMRHLCIAKGPGGELRTQLYIAMRRKYISPELGDELIMKTKRLGGMIFNFIAARRKQNRITIVKNILAFFHI